METFFSRSHEWPMCLFYLKMPSVVVVVLYFLQHECKMIASNKYHCLVASKVIIDTFFCSQPSHLLIVFCFNIKLCFVIFVISIKTFFTSLKKHWFNIGRKFKQVLILVSFMHVPIDYISFLLAEVNFVTSVILMEQYIMEKNVGKCMHRLDTMCLQYGSRESWVLRIRLLSSFIHLGVPPH